MKLWDEINGMYQTLRAQMPPPMTYMIHPWTYQRLRQTNPELFNSPWGLGPHLIISTEVVDWRVEVRRWRKRKFPPPCRKGLVQYRPYAYPSNDVWAVKQ